jgi:CheY-like chemotaxis protein
MMTLSGEASKQMRAETLAIFLVEDEALIRMMIADMIDELGHQVVAEAGEVEQAVAIAQSNEMDLAILDVNIAQRPIDPVAMLLADRGFPFIFASGYGRKGIPEAFRNHVVLQKPFLVKALAQAISEALARSP